jgi:uncharacterized protein with HEPN domain
VREEGDASGTKRFTAIPRASQDTGSRPVDRWPAVRDALRELLAECESVTSAGKAEFMRTGSLTYRAAEAIVMHFGDIVRVRLTDERRASVRLEIPYSAIVTTRNIIAHDYLEADREIIWNVMVGHIPAAIGAILATDSGG